MSLKITALLLGALICAAAAQELDVAYVVTPDEVVELMLDMAHVGRGDYVIDLGTGDGRIVIAAVKRGASGLGVDLDPQRVQEAKQNAVLAGVSDSVRFVEQDLFETDISQATVVMMFLNHEVNLRLRPTLLETLQPGTRIVSHNFALGDWQPDKHQQYLRNADNNFYIHDVFYWEVPADIEGEWQGKVENDTLHMTIDQVFQRIKIEVVVDDRHLVIEEASLHGSRINIIGRDRSNSAKYIFSGSVENQEIDGTVLKRTGDSATELNWQASQ